MENNNINVKNIKHIAIIMDGNRRWARSNGLKLVFGHKAGLDNLLKIASYAESINVKYMTVYAFSKENWNRTQEEVSYLMDLFREFGKKILEKSVNELKNVKIKFFGNSENVDDDLSKLVHDIEEMTKNNTGFNLNICFNYSGRQEIIDAIKNIVKKVNNGEFNINDLNEDNFKNYLYSPETPYPDLIIRTGKEIRLSNFLLWQNGYSELYFTDKLWPDFDINDLNNAILNFNNRKQNNGK